MLARTATEARAAIGNRGRSWCGELGPTITAGLDVTLTVSVLARLPLVGKIPEVGLNAHVTPAGRDGQLNVN
jgi:hypothetical protein